MIDDPPLLLTDLDPHWRRHVDDVYSLEDPPQVTRETATGIRFACPRCFLDNGRQRPGVHSIVCWDPSVPQTVTPIPGRWNMVGSGFDDLSLVAGSSSILLDGDGGCHAHFFIRNGRIEW